MRADLEIQDTDLAQFLADYINQELANARLHRQKLTITAAILMTAFDAYEKEQAMPKIPVGMEKEQIDSPIYDVTYAERVVEKLNAGIGEEWEYRVLLYGDGAKIEVLDETKTVVGYM